MGQDQKDAVGKQEGQESYRLFWGEGEKIRPEEDGDEGDEEGVAKAPAVGCVGKAVQEGAGCREEEEGCEYKKADLEALEALSF